MNNADEQHTYHTCWIFQLQNIPNNIKQHQTYCSQLVGRHVWHVLRRLWGSDLGPAPETLTGRLWSEGTEAVAVGEVGWGGPAK